MGVSARHVPTDEEARQAVEVLLGAVEAGGDIFEALDTVRPLHPKDNTFPGEVFVRLAADALDEGSVSRDRPIPEEGLVEQYLPECKFRGRDNHKIRYAILAVAAVHGGVQLDLLEEVAYWATDDFWKLCRPGCCGLGQGGGRPARDGAARAVRGAAGPGQALTRPPISSGAGCPCHNRSCATACGQRRRSRRSARPRLSGTGTRPPCSGAPSSPSSSTRRPCCPSWCPLAPSTTLFERFVPALSTLLSAHGASPAFTGAEAEEMAERRVAKTSNRSVVGIMNEFTFLAEAYSADRGDLDLGELSLRLAETPCGPLYKRHISPDRC